MRRQAFRSVRRTSDQHPERSEREYNDEYNIGIFMGMPAHNQVGHTGGDPGVSSLMFFDTTSNIGMLLMVNTDLDKESADEFIAIWRQIILYENRL